MRKFYEIARKYNNESYYISRYSNLYEALKAFDTFIELDYEKIILSYCEENSNCCGFATEIKIFNNGIITTYKTNEQVWGMAEYEQ